MAVPASFEESNAVLDKPNGMKLDNVEPLSVYRGPNCNGVPVVVSCWKITADELAEITKTGRIWLIAMGASHPPIAVDGTNPFTEESQ